MYLLIKYIKSVLWRVAKRLSYIEDARCLKVKVEGNVFLVFNYARQLEGLGGSAGIAAGILNSVLDGDVY
jgi:hypothetical protein